MNCTPIFRRTKLQNWLNLSLIAAFLLFANGIFAQGWLRHYPSGSGEEPKQMVIAPNGDFLFAGVDHANNAVHFYVQRNDAAGNKLWLKTIQISSQIPGTTFAEMYFLKNCLRFDHQT